MNIHTRQMNVDLTDPSSIVRAAVSHIDVGQPERARSLLESASTVYYTEYSVAAMLGNVCVMLGDFDAAMVAYGRALGADPKSLEVLLNLANVHHLRGDLKNARTYAEAALAVDGTSVEAEFRLILLGLDRPEAAIKALDALLARAPNFAPALYQRAMLFLAANNPVSALSDITQCIDADPRNPDAFFIRGSMFLDHGHTDAAIVDYHEAIALGADNYALRYNLANALLAVGREQEAIEEFALAANHDPQSPEPYFNMGTICLSLNDAETAIAFFNRALELKPHHLDALNNRGAAYKHLKQYPAALSDYREILKHENRNGRALYNASTICFEIKDFPSALDYAENAIEADPKNVDAYLAKGRVLFETAQFDEAVKNFELAIKADPTNPEPHLNLGHVYRIKRNFDQAITCYEAALANGSKNRYLRGDLFFTKLQTCDWSSYEQDVQALVEQIHDGRSSASPFTLVCFSNTPADQYSVAKAYASEQFTLKTDIDPISFYPQHDKIRIGYYSADFHNHATMHLMASLFEMHNREKFEIYAFSFGPQVKDEMRERAELAFDYFIDASELSDKAVALASRHFEIDVAIDLKGYTTHCRPNIFAYRAAPVQINYLGFPGTMGAEFIDYVVADPILISKDEEQFYSERVLRLPNCYQVNDQLRPPLQRQFSRAELGLPENKFVYCSFNNNYKILPSTIDAWAQILKAVPDSVFWILADNKTAQKNLIEAFSVRGIDPERLIFAERMGAHLHLARQTCADLFLDTFPCAAHTTASDAVFAGLPILALAGETFASRVAASILYAVGLPDLVTKTMPDYIERAIELGRNPESCKQLSAYLKQTVRLSPLFNTQQTTRELEELYIQALREKQGQ